MKKYSNLIIFIILLIIIGILVYFWQDIAGIFESQEKISEWIKSFGTLGPLVFITLQSLQVMIAPLPGVALSALAGIFFGVFWGTIYSLLGIVLGSVAIFYLVRKLGRSFVESHADPKMLHRFDHLSEKAGPLLFFILFLLPFPPDDIVCFLAGLTSIPLPYLTAILILGRLPLVALTTASVSLTSLGWQSWLFLVLIFALLALFLYIYSERIIEFFERKR